jgi:hypothetical protein
MKAKEYTFSMKYAFIAEDEKDALRQMQENLNDWDESVTDANNWQVEVEDVEISEEVEYVWPFKHYAYEKLIKTLEFYLSLDEADEACNSILNDAISTDEHIKLLKLYRDSDVDDTD